MISQLDSPNTPPTMVKRLKRSIRKLGHQMGLMRDWDQLAATGTERPSTWYDQAYSSNESYHTPFYQSCYYGTWLVVVDRLQRYGCKKILDIGCGPGQFAELVLDWQFPKYTGVDFSAVAIEKAQQAVPQYKFVIADVLKPGAYRDFEFDCIVSMEVLEHIEADTAVVSSFPPGIRCLVTVPNFPYVSHVRHFDTCESVANRYGRFFTDATITRLKGTRDEFEQFFLLDGVRNTVVE
jgi:SAM-dependent methyltransferase